MGKETGIAWTDHTFNVAWGCAKVSPGCAHCYAENLSGRYGHDVWGEGAARRVFGQKHWNEPLAWNKAAEKAGVRARVFSSSMCDVFEDHPTIIGQLPRLWALIRQTPWLDWQLLTKRHDRIALSLPDDWADGYPNVWLGVSVENQHWAEVRILPLLRVPAVVRFVSAEPLLGPLNLDRIDVPGLAIAYLNALEPHRLCVNDKMSSLDWVIVGGESGPGARPCQLAWIDWIVRGCRANDVAVFVKQLGANFHSNAGPMKLRDHKGGDPSEWAQDLRQSREFP